VKSGEFKQAPDKYREEPPLTGNQSRVQEVSGVEFPQPLDPVDDLPPATVITRVQKTANGFVLSGTASDNGTIRRVTVNGQEAKAVTANFAEWTIELPASTTVFAAHAEDAAGNVEKLVHKVAAVPAP
jgi:hypothetical protein